MKLVTAVIKPIRLESVCAALEKAGFLGMTATEVQGRGAQGGRTEYYRGQPYAVAFRTKIRLELVVADADVDRVLDLILESARTGDNGEIGDGKVWVTQLNQILRVRTGESGDAAI